MKPSPVFQLLLLSAQLRPRAERLRELVDGGVDWQAFLDLAAWHRVRPLVYKNLTVVLPAPFGPTNPHVPPCEDLVAGPFFKLCGSLPNHEEEPRSKQVLSLRRSRLRRCRTEEGKR